MRSSSSGHGLRGHSSWSHVKAGLAERKLRLAANMNNVEGLRQLLTAHEGGVDPNCGDEHKRTALHMAAAKGYADVVRVLLDHGAKPNQVRLLSCTLHFQSRNI
jgi:ankyrin repeat protein